MKVKIDIFRLRLDEILLSSLRLRLMNKSLSRVYMSLLVLDALVLVLSLPEAGELFTLVVGYHSGLTWSPFRWAHLPVLISELESLNKPQNLVDVSANRQVIHRDLPQDALVINDVSGPHGNTCIVTLFNEAAVVFGDLLGEVREHWDLHWADSSLDSWLLRVLHVHEVGVDGAADELAVVLSELRGLVVELANLSWAHKSEIEWPEEEHHVLSSELLEADLLEFALVPGGAFEGRSWLADDSLGAGLSLFCACLHLV